MPGQESVLIQVNSSKNFMLKSESNVRFEEKKMKTKTKKNYRYPN